MKLKKIFLIFILIFLFSCEKKEENLFFINSYEDLMQKAKSEKLTYISKEKKTVLTTNEIISNYRTYKMVDTVFENDEFKVIIILSEGEGNNYDFLVRTIHQGDYKIIGTFLLGGYNEKSKQFCGGFINRDLVLKRYCKSDKFTFEKRINKQGEIVDIS